MAINEHEALRGIAERRASDTACDRVELERRLAELGDMPLRSAERHEAFEEIYAAFTPTGFRLLPFPDETSIHAGAQRLRLAAVIVDETHRQVAGEIQRYLQFDTNVVEHQLLRLQSPYKGNGLSLVLLRQALPLYRALGFELVSVHAALQTGRWQWARLGFEFADNGEREAVVGWALIANLALGQGPIPLDIPARRIAHLGTGEPAVEVSLAKLHEAIVQHPDWQDAMPLRPLLDVVLGHCEPRFRAEWQERYGALDRERFELIAMGNGIDLDQPIPLGKAIMLSGPDWWGTFRLDDASAADAFEREFSRRFSRLTPRGG